MKCKNCNKEMEEIDSGFDEAGDMNIDFACYHCGTYLMARWLAEKPQRVKWLTKNNIKSGI